LLLLYLLRLISAVFLLLITPLGRRNTGNCYCCNALIAGQRDWELLNQQDGGAVISD
jgi:hypothetical protein